jgi:hypothetical protein
MHKRTLRPALAMIELIFSIVIIGIVMLTAPMLIQTAAQSGYVAIQQESISQAASRVSMIMGYNWDENGTGSNERAPILQTGGDSELNNNSGSWRAGTPIESLRNFRFGSDENLTSTPISFLGPDAAENDIDDFKGIYHLTFITTAHADNLANYIETGADINMSINVAYISDEANYDKAATIFDFNTEALTGNDTSNIKMIEVKLTSANHNVGELDKEIVLRAFSCNIGEYRLEERSFYP